MKFKNPLLVVEDMEKAKAFYKEVLGLRMIMDFGANVTLTGGISLQTKESWKAFIKKNDKDIVYGGNDAELYFEEDDFDVFLEKLHNIPYIEYVHPVVEHGWGQRAIRFYDVDGHIIEVGENMKAVCCRFMNQGLSIEEVADRMDAPVKFVRSCLR